MTVGRIAQRPIPVTVDGTVVVTGDVNVVNTPDVNVVNTPDVNVVNTPDVNVVNDVLVHGTVDIGNTPDVNVVNTPNVSVTNTPNVNVTNTPSVNVANTPNVQVTNMVAIAAGDSPSIDAFSRLRISPPVTLFDSSLQYGLTASAQFFDGLALGAGSAVELLAESAVSLRTVGIAIGDGYIRQSHVYIRYQPGKSQLVLCTFCFDEGLKAGVRRRVGYFDGNDGIFLEVSGTTINVVLRSSSGSPTEVVPQANWNLDTLLGGGGASNPSGLTLDISKVEIFIIDFQWLGVGRVRVGFDIGGLVYYVHEFLNANTTKTAVYMKTGCLPIRYEIENIAPGPATPSSFKQICSSVISEGGFETARGLQFSTDRGTTTVTAASGVYRPVLSIRAKTTGPAGVQNTGQILPQDFDILAGGNPATYRILLGSPSNPVVLTTGGNPAAVVWSDVSTNYSLAQANTNADGFTGGQVIAAGNITASAAIRGSTQASLIRNLALVYSTLLGTQDSLTILAAGAGGNATILAALTWQELY